MSENGITNRDRKWAKICEDCLVCGHARRKQKGIAYWLVKNIESRICPACRAYEKVHGRKAHEPIPSSETGKDQP